MKVNKRKNKIGLLVHKIVSCFETDTWRSEFFWSGFLVSGGRSTKRLHQSELASGHQLQTVDHLVADPSGENNECFRIVEVRLKNSF